MKANELWVGNLVALDNSKIVRVIWVKFELVCVIEVGTEYPSAIVNIERLSGINLTEEWLAKFGATNITENQYRIKNRLFILRNGYWTDYGSSVSLQYVHKLQNLYFALTGEELAIYI